MSTVEVARQGPRPAIRLRPAPRYDPPFDDERDPDSWSASPHQLALDWSRPVRNNPPPAPPPPTKRTIVEGVSGDAKLAVRRFVSACVEVLNGHRPAAHLRRLAQPHDAATLVAEGLAGARRVAETRRQPRTRTQRPTPVAVSRLRLCEPRAGAVEAAVVLVIGDQTWAMAFRLEQQEEAWLAKTMRLL
jgi:hypothetical protein